MASKLNSRIWGSQCGLCSHSPGLEGLRADLPLDSGVTPGSTLPCHLCVWVTQSFACPSASRVSSHVQVHRITGKNPVSSGACPSASRVSSHVQVHRITGKNPVSSGGSQSSRKEIWISWSPGLQMQVFLGNIEISTGVDFRGGDSSCVVFFFLKVCVKLT